MPLRIAYLAFAAAALSLACSSTGGLYAGDAAAPAEPADAPDASDGAEKPPDASSVATNDGGKAPTVDCAGLCRKAAKTFFTCDTTKCEAQCNARATAAEASCAPEWETYLDCAVRGGVVTKCEYNGKVTVSGCDDETIALTTCVNKPKTCVAGCTNDAQCQSTCPTPSGGKATCCDITTGVCFVTSQLVCPSPVPAPTPPPSY